MDQQVLLHLLGRLHPSVVHFPIALLVVAGAVELFRKRGARPGDAGLLCLVVGALSAALAAWLGWLYADFDPPGRSVERTLFLHRWAGVATAGISLLTVCLALAVRRSKEGGPVGFYRLGLLLCVGLVGYSGHLGGTLVYGEGFLLDVLDRDAASGTPADEPEPQELELRDPMAATAGVEYVSEVVPILAARCYECHGSTGRAKAGLKLDDMADVFAGDPEDWVIRPGDAGASLVYQRISLPADHEDAMPAKGDRLTAEEIELIERWIDGGATWSGEVESAEPAEPTETGARGGAAESLVATPGVATPAPPVGVRFLNDEQRAARHQALEAIVAVGAHAALVAQDTDEVEANLGLLGERATDATLLLLDGLEPCLVSLDLSRSAVTDAGVAQLTRFERLRRLRLDGTTVGDAGVAHLAGLQSLEVVNLVGTRVTDAGLDALARIDGLERVYLWNTEVTEAGEELLAVVAPGLDVVRGAEGAAGVPLDPATGAVQLEQAPCCAEALAAGRTCDHPCCVEAASAGEVCSRCAGVGG